MTPLCELAKHFGTDKGGAHINSPPGYHDTCHNYTPAYHQMFKDRREQVRRVLEIGIGHGCSLRMWRDYFPQAQIAGIDSNKACLFAEDRIRCFVADQYNGGDLMAVIEDLDHPKFDLIVDDGSHEPAHQLFSAKVLLCMANALAKDGVYVIEDIEPDCKPGLLGNAITEKTAFTWRPVPTGRGLGRAYCRCGCETGEQLVVLQHA